MKKSIFSRILVIAAGVILIAAAVTVKQVKANWQYGEAYGYQIWCDLGRFCSGPISLRSWDYWRLWEFDPYYDPNWWGNYQNWWDDPYLWNPLEIRYGLCEWLPSYGLQYGLPCACMTTPPMSWGGYPSSFFMIIDEEAPSCGYAILIS